MGKYDLDNGAYDQWLASKGKERELRARKAEKRSANTGVKGWHFGVSEKPFHAKDVHEFRQALDKRGCMMRDDVKKELK